MSMQSDFCNSKYKFSFYGLCKYDLLVDAIYLIHFIVHCSEKDKRCTLLGKALISFSTIDNLYLGGSFQYFYSNQEQ